MSPFTISESCHAQRLSLCWSQPVDLDDHIWRPALVYNTHARGVWWWLSQPIRRRDLTGMTNQHRTLLIMSTIREPRIQWSTSSLSPLIHPEHNKLVQLKISNLPRITTSHILYYTIVHCNHMNTLVCKFFIVLTYFTKKNSSLTSRNSNL